MRKVIRLTETDIHNIVAETVKKILKEDISMKHSGHNFDNFLDDNDFIKIVDTVKEYYSPEDIANSDDIDDVEIHIAQIIKEFVDEEAVGTFGYKYGTGNYRTTASNVIDFILKNR